jgi:hypothetical protein
VNAYFCDAGEHEFVSEYIAGHAVHEPWRACDIVFEGTPGKAKSRFWHRYSKGVFDYIEIKARLLAVDVCDKPGFAHSTDPLWDVAGNGLAA